MKRLFRLVLAFSFLLTLTSLASPSSNRYCSDLTINEKLNQNYILAYVVDNNIYFQQLECAQRYIGFAGGIITGRAYVRESQALSCLDLED